MSDAARRRRVTIPLGLDRSGQAVKRDVWIADASFSASVGMKRSVRDRIGNNSGSSLCHGNEFSSNKRQRGHISMSNGLNDVRIGRDDLRLKLMQNNSSRQAETNGDKRHIDLREKLSKAHPPLTPINSKQQIPEPSETRMQRQTPLARTSDDLTQMESLRCSYSPSKSSHNLSRQRSPDGSPRTSSRMSPRRNAEDLQRRSLNRTYNGVRPVPYVTRDAFEPTRPPSTAPSLTTRMTASTLHSIAAKPAASHLGQIPPPNSISQKASYVGGEQKSFQTVDGLLQALGLGKYANLFKTEEVDMTALRQMRENDLKEMGIPMGPRKKILLAILPRTKRQQ